MLVRGDKNYIYDSIVLKASVHKIPAKSDTNDKIDFYIKCK